MSHPVESFSVRASRRIGRLTLVIGLATALAVLAAGYARWSAGLAAGTLLAWINHRWLEQITSALVTLSTAQANRVRPQVPAGTYLKMIGRYFLLGCSAYVIVSYWAVPVSSILVGLLALGAAAITEGLYEVFAHPR